MDSDLRANMESKYEIHNLKRTKKPIGLPVVFSKFLLPVFSCIYFNHHLSFFFEKKKKFTIILVSTSPRRVRISGIV